jgi:ABC-type glutathione transport system ATPase component
VLVLVLALADRVFVLERGAVVHQGPAKPTTSPIEKKFCDCRPQLAQGNGRPMAP